MVNPYYSDDFWIASKSIGNPVGDDVAATVAIDGIAEGNSVCTG